ncbi:MAG: glutathione-disulfide reductase [Porticoccaceae bacterium]|nr:glutathione-disulfide reductase [Pseudomonadales bacterium]MCP5171645.1 glutathione-disulfide reductase [Pseudomonadales bacterium]
MNYDYDLFVIGAGSGGVRTARMSAQYGARVAVAEEQYLGGTCVNVGCVPKKLFTYAAAFSEECRAARGFGWNSGSPTFDWPTLIKNKNAEIERLNDIYLGLLKKAGVDLLNGRATIVDAHTLEVNGQHYTADKILVAVGGTPFVPDFPGSEHAITSNEAFYLEALPERIIVVGGGYIAVEFAGIFNGLGVETHLVYRGPLFLRGFDTTLRKSLEENYKKQGITLHFSTEIESLESCLDGQIKAQLSDGSGLKVGQVMYATGRIPNTRNLGLENTTVKTTSNGSIVVNEHFQSTESNIYALGDVIDRIALTPVAIAEGMVLSANLYNNQSLTMDYDNIPSAVFSHPHIGTVGLTEEQAREQYGDDIAVFESNFKPMKETLGGGHERIVMKLIVDKNTDRVIGCHMLGDHAGEVIQGLAVAMKAGATKADFDHTIGIHPTAAEEFVTLRTPNQN